MVVLRHSAHSWSRRILSTSSKRALQIWKPHSERSLSSTYLECKGVLNAVFIVEGEIRRVRARIWRGCCAEPNKSGAVGWSSCLWAAFFFPSPSHLPCMMANKNDIEYHSQSNNSWVRWRGFKHAGNLFLKCLWKGEALQKNTPALCMFTWWTKIRMIEDWLWSGSFCVLRACAWWRVIERAEKEGGIMHGCL